MEKKVRVLMVDDEVDFCSAVAEYLEHKQCIVVQTHNCEQFSQELNRAQPIPDVVLIDKRISNEDGYELIHDIRTNETLQSLPVIVLTACSAIDDRVKALQMGADDLLVKPVAMEELYARIEAALRRSNSYITPERTITFKNLRINLRTHQVVMDEALIDLTSTEYRIFLELVIKRGEILPREKLAAKFLTSRNNNPRTLDVHVTSLRRKLGLFSDHVKTVRGRGYMFSEIA